jgi:2Fe-2S ferredoxin
MRSVAESVATRAVRVLPLDVNLELGPDETVIEAAWRSGYYWPTVCGGRAECTACHLYVEEGADRLVAPEAVERQMLGPLVAKLKPSVPVRLACRLRVVGPVTVRKKSVRKRITE